MQLFYDTGISAFVTSPTNRSPINSFAFNLGDTGVTIPLTFCKNGVGIEIDPGSPLAAGILQIKLPTQFSGQTPLVFATAWIKTSFGATALYTFTPNFNSLPLADTMVNGIVTGRVANLAALYAITGASNGQIYNQIDTGAYWQVIDANNLGNASGWQLAPQFPSLQVVAAIQWNLAGAISTTSLLTGIINNDLIKGTEGTPSEIPDLKASDAEAIDPGDGVHWTTPHAVWDMAQSLAGILFAKELPGVSALVGGAGSDLDAQATVGLPSNFHVTFCDPVLGTQNYYIKIGAVPGGGAPKYVTPVDNGASGCYWQQG